MAQKESESNLPDDDCSSPNKSKTTMDTSITDPLSNLEDFTERFSQQQEMISQLKEMVIAEETARNQKLADTRLKLEKYTSHLARIRDKTKANRRKPQVLNPLTVKEEAEDVNIVDTKSKTDATIKSNLVIKSESFDDVSSTTHVTDLKSNRSKLPSHGVTKMLHQQIKEQKAIIAERAKTEKELEQAVIKIQKQLEANQSQPLDTHQTINVEEKFESQKIILELKNRIISLENNILDLQETCKEKDSVIKSKTDAITLMSADLSKKGKETLDLLDDTKEQMQKMQENFATMESNMKLEKQSLLSELEACKNKVIHLEEANSILEEERFKLSIENNNLEEKLTINNAEIEKLNTEMFKNISEIERLMKQSSDDSNNKDSEKEKGSIEVAEMDKLSKRIEELENINIFLKESNEQLQEKLNNTNIEKEIEIPDFFNKLLTEEKTEYKENSSAIPNILEEVIQYLNEHILDLELRITEKEDKIKTYEASPVNIEILREENNKNILDVDKPNQQFKDLIKINFALRRSNIELQNTLEESNKKINILDGDKKTLSPEKSNVKNKPGFKKGKQNKNKTENLEKSQKLNKTELDKENENIKTLTKTISQLNQQLVARKLYLNQKETELNVLLKNCSVRNNNEKEKPCASIGNEPIVKNVENNENTLDTNRQSEIDSEFLSIETLKIHLDDALKKIESLSKDLTESNKNMIKLKATHKIKIKEMQKCIDDYSKVSDSNSEVIKLQNEVKLLTQKITELEDDKGNLQLHLVDYDNDRVPESQLLIKLKDIEQVAEERLKAIADLEMQKFELVQVLHAHKQLVTSLEDKVADLSYLENDHVSNEIKYAQLEEQLDILKAENRKKLLEIDTLISEKNDLTSTIELLNKEKVEINAKLEYYIQENIELIERLDKLSAEKVSSAESIEMVESLTTQEKIEMEHYQKTYDACHIMDKDEMKYEENLVKTNIEKGEIESKIDLCKQLEIEEKIDSLQTINNSLESTLKQLLLEKNQLEEEYNLIKNERDNIIVVAKLNEEKIIEINKEIEKLLQENKILNDRIEELVQNKAIKTEVVISETIEIEDTIENKIIQSPSDNKASINAPTLKDSPGTEKSEDCSKSNVSKTDKKSTKEILRLKNVIKTKDLEINDLNLKLNELHDLKQQNENLFVDLNNLNQQLQMLSQNAPQNKRLSEADTENETLQTQKCNTKELSKDSKNNENEQHDNHTIHSINSEHVIFTLKYLIDLLNAMINENEDEKNDSLCDLNKYGNCSDKINYLLLEIQEKVKISQMILINKRLQIKDILDEKNAVSNQILQLKEYCFNKDEEVKNINLQLSELNMKFNANSDVMSQYKSNINQLNEDCQILQMNKNELEEKNIKLEKINEDMQMRINGLESEITIKNDQISDIQMHLRDVNSTFYANTEDFEKSKKEIHVAQNKLLLLETRYNELETKYKDALCKIESLESQATYLQNESSKISLEKQNILSELHALKEENNNMYSQNKKIESQLLKCNIQLEEFAQQNRVYSEKLEIKVNECEDMKIALSKIETFEDQLNSKQTEICTLIEQLEKLQSNYDEFKSAQEAKLQEKDAYIESVEIDFKNLKEKNVRLENQVSLMESLEKKAKKLVLKLKEKDSTFTKVLEHEKELRNKLMELENQDHTNKNKLLELSEENRSLSDLINNLQNNKNGLETELNAIKTESCNLTNRVLYLEALDKENNKIAEQYADLEFKLKEMSIEYNDNMKKKITECELLESTLQAQTDTLEDQLEQYKEQYKKVQDEMMQQLQKLKDIECENEQLKIENENLNYDKINLKSSLSPSVEPNYFEGQEIAISNLQNEISRLNFELNEKNLEIEKYQQQYVQSLTASTSTEITSNETGWNWNNDETENKNWKAECFEKEKYIQDLYIQYKDCLNHLSQITEVEKKLKEEQEKLVMCINEKNSIIINLENKIKELHVLQNENVVSKKNIQTQLKSTPPSSEISSLSQNEEYLKSLQDQIVLLDSSDNKKDFNTDTCMIRAFQHDAPIPIEKTNIPITSSNVELVEEKIDPKTTYLCYNKNVEDVKENKSDTKTKMKNPKDSQIDYLESTIKLLSDEKRKLESDLQQSQQKTNKALLKLKEFKLRHDNLNNELKKLRAEQRKNIDSLDTAIQDELSSQIKNLETTVNNMKIASEKDILEKESLLKQIDVLTTANEQLINLKEKQDFDLQTCLSKNKLLSEKIDNIQWNNDFSDGNSKQCSCSDELGVLKNENDHLKVEIDNLNEKFEEYEEKTKLLIHEKEVLQSQHDVVLASIEELKGENIKLLFLETKLNLEIDGILEEKKAIISDHNNTCEELKNVLREKELLREEINKKTDEINDIQNILKNSMTKMTELHQNITECEENYKFMENKLQQQINNLEEKLTNVVDTSRTSQKEACEIVQQLKDTETKLEQTINENNENKKTLEDQLSLERSKYEKLLSEHETLKYSINDKEEKISEINNSLYVLQEEKKYLEEVISSKDFDLQKYYNYEAMCNNKFNEYNAILSTKDSEILEKLNEINILKEDFKSLNLQLHTKFSEIASLQQKILDYDTLTQELSQTETKLNDIIHEKDVETANLRLKLHDERTNFDSIISENTNKISFLEEQLQSKIDECNELNQRISELQALIDEEATQMEEMRSALEAQEIEIVTLKENLGEYVHRAKIEKHVSFSEDTKLGDDYTIENKNDEEKSRADLDLALYMLHQRDVRCEELTVELMQLLEERDTLQLKLSNAIRMIEDFKNNKNNINIPQSSATINTSTTSHTQDKEPPYSETASTSTMVSNDELKSKLSELHSVNHLRDVRVKDERESRQKQMELLQRDIKNLPPEAVAQLREAHYTLSRDTQSASTVLFNWLWGKTTPKVVHM